MYLTRAMITPYLPVNMRGRGLRVYQGGQRGNGIGIFKPIFTCTVVPVTIFTYPYKAYLETLNYGSNASETI